MIESSITLTTIIIITFLVFGIRRLLMAKRVRERSLHVMPVITSAAKELAPRVDFKQPADSEIVELATDKFRNLPEEEKHLSGQDRINAIARHAIGDVIKRYESQYRTLSFEPESDGAHCARCGTDLGKLPQQFDGAMVCQDCFDCLETEAGDAPKQRWLVGDDVVHALGCDKAEGASIVTQELDEIAKDSSLKMCPDCDPWKTHHLLYRQGLTRFAAKLKERLETTLREETT